MICFDGWADGRSACWRNMYTRVVDGWVGLVIKVN